MSDACSIEVGNRLDDDASQASSRASRHTTSERSLRPTRLAISASIRRRESEGRRLPGTCESRNVGQQPSPAVALHVDDEGIARSDEYFDLSETAPQLLPQPHRHPPAGR